MRIDKRDNVEVDITSGHKKALTDIKKGEAIIKYGYPIGCATEDIKTGELVHSHNLKTLLSGKVSYEFNKKTYSMESPKEERFFYGFLRENGEVGIRNEIFIINTVGCINSVAERIAEITGERAFPHPYGCSQLGDDFKTTIKILCGLIRHPNAAGVLVLGLGCENSNIAEFKKELGSYDPERVLFLNCQDAENEVEEGVRLVRILQERKAKYKREKLPLSKLIIGLKCGGSDGFSGITANPLVGRISDKLVSYGGSAILTEVPEMFGAETILMDRAKSEEVFNKTVNLINNFKDYYERHNQVIYENPSPGNKAGGITTLEEKSLGCVTKGGFSEVVDVLSLGEKVKERGLSLLDGPGNDMVAITNLASSGAHLILFTTGRGTPLGGPVPTVKISSNTPLFEKKGNWLDFDAGRILAGEDLTEEFFEFIIKIASGEETKNEVNGFREIAIFKNGVTL